MESTIFEKRANMQRLLEKNKLILVTHLKDIDGIGSAAMALIALKPERVIFSDYGKKPALELLKDFSEAPKGKVIMFVDISLSEDAAEVYKDLFSKLKKNGNIIIWIDHHPIQEKALSILKEFSDFAIAGEQKVCGAELLYEEVIKPLGILDSKLEKIKMLAHLSDFNVSGTPYDEKLKKATEAIASYLDNTAGMQEGLLKIAMAFAKDPENFDKDKFVSERAGLYESMQKKLKEELASNTYIVGNENFKAIIGFNFSGSLQSNDGCYFLLGLEEAKKAKANGAIYVKVKLGSCHIRTNNENIDTRKLAQELGGNGHPGASAFPIPKEFDLSTKEGITKFVNFIDSMIKELYKNDSKAKINV
ncbi:MAG: DHH family phosphoesterase [Candidatus Micrarchaeia archaeon]|jgi:nanoRNase/pAp phosphatase (c-di-AMP/oligoRNAs hydrolase)